MTFPQSLTLLSLVLLGTSPEIYGADTSCFQTPDLIAAKHKTCPGNQFEIYNVSLTTLFNKGLGRHPLFRGEEVEICISGRATGITSPKRFLQNSVHGKINLLLDVFSPFCDINLNGCAALTPPCTPEAAIVPNQEFCFCSKLQVPAVAPSLNVVTYWKILAVENAAETNQCETEFSVNRLSQKRKETLVCLEIPAMVRGSRPKGFERDTIIQKVLAERGGG